MKNNILTKAILCLVAAALIASAGFALGLSFSTSGSPEPEEHTVYVDKPVAECSSLVYGDAGLSSLGTEAELDLIKAVRAAGPYEVDAADWITESKGSVTVSHPSGAVLFVMDKEDLLALEYYEGEPNFEVGRPDYQIFLDQIKLPDSVSETYGVEHIEIPHSSVTIYVYQNAPAGMGLLDTAGSAKFYSRSVLIGGVEYEMSEHDYFGGGETYLRELAGYLPSGDFVYVQEGLTSPYGDYRVRAELTFRVLSEILKSLQVN